MGTMRVRKLTWNFKKEMKNNIFASKINKINSPLWSRRPCFIIKIYHPLAFSFVTTTLAILTLHNPLLCFASLKKIFSVLDDVRLVFDHSWWTTQKVYKSCRVQNMKWNHGAFIVANTNFVLNESRSPRENKIWTKASMVDIYRDIFCLPQCSLSLLMRCSWLWTR